MNDKNKVGKAKQFYYSLRNNYVTFRVMIFLKEIGFVKLSKTLLGLYKFRNTPYTKQNIDTQEFIEKNRDRINGMLKLLADEKSCEVWKAVMQYRATNTPIPSKLWSDTDQYFPHDLRAFFTIKDEVFIDGGAFIGDTIQHLFNYGKTNVRKIIAFEPNPDNLKLLKTYYGKNKKIVIIEEGLGRTKGIAYFRQNGSGSQVVEEDGESVISIPIGSIDETQECQDATYIKMDIEGAEMEALAGAAETIRRNKPKLAICIYHSLDDMVRIIEYVHEIEPDYKLYVRHHTGDEGETVMYAIPFS